LKDLFKSNKHPTIESHYTEGILKKNASVLSVNSLRMDQERNEKSYHFFLDYMNFCCYGASVREEDALKQLSKALNKHFEELVESNPVPEYVTANPKAGAASTAGAAAGKKGWGDDNRQGAWGRREQANTGSNFQALTLADLAIQKKAPKKKAAGDGEKPAVKKVEKKAAPEPKKEPEVKQTHWSCPRCTLDNELHAQRCIACDFSRTQAKLMDEFPTLGAAPKKKK
jgi:hypothetical protein